MQIIQKQVHDHFNKKKQKKPEIFIFITFLVFNLLSLTVFFINRKEKKNC